MARYSKVGSAPTKQGAKRVIAKNPHLKYCMACGHKLRPRSMGGKTVLFCTTCGESYGRGG